MKHILFLFTAFISILFSSVENSYAEHFMAKNCEIYPVDVEYVRSSSYGRGGGYRTDSYNIIYTFVTKSGVRLKQKGIKDDYGKASSWDNVNSDIMVFSFRYATGGFYGEKTYQLKGTPFIETIGGDYYWLQRGPYENINFFPGVVDWKGLLAPQISRQDMIKRADFYSCLTDMDWHFINAGINDSSSKEILDYLTINSTQEKLHKVVAWSKNMKIDSFEKIEILEAIVRASYDNRKILVRVLDILRKQYDDEQFVKQEAELVKLIVGSKEMTDSILAYAIDTLDNTGHLNDSEIVKYILTLNSAGKKATREALRFFKNSNISKEYAHDLLVKVLDDKNLVIDDLWAITWFLGSYRATVLNIELIANRYLEVLITKFGITWETSHTLSTFLFKMFINNTQTINYAENFNFAYSFFTKVLNANFSTKVVSHDIIKSLAAFSLEKLSADQSIQMIERVINSSEFTSDLCYAFIYFFENSQFQQKDKNLLIEMLLNADGTKDLDSFRKKIEALKV